MTCAVGHVAGDSVTTCHMSGYHTWIPMLHWFTPLLLYYSAIAKNRLEDKLLGTRDTYILLGYIE